MTPWLCSFLLKTMCCAATGERIMMDYEKSELYLSMRALSMLLLGCGLLCCRLVKQQLMGGH